MEGSKVKRMFKFRSKSIALLILIFSIVAIYVFFFMSPLIFQAKEGELLLTPLNEPVNISTNINVTVEDWQYSESEQKMEVILSFENTATTDASEKYVYQVVSRNAFKSESYVDYKVTYQSSSFASIIIKDVPKDFAEIGLYVCCVTKGDGITAESDEEQSAFNTVFTNKYDVQKTDKIEPLSILQLYIDKLDKNIADYEQQIKDLENDNDTFENKKQDILKRVAELKNSENYMTSEDIKAVEEQIENYDSSYKNFETQIGENKTKINNLKKQKDEANEKKSELEKIKTNDIDE